MGAGWQIFKTIVSAPFEDDETMTAISNGEQVGLFSGKPKGKQRYGAHKKRDPSVTETADAIGRGQQVGLFTGKPKGSPPVRSLNETAEAIAKNRRVGLFSGKPKD